MSVKRAVSGSTAVLAAVLTLGCGDDGVNGPGGDAFQALVGTWECTSYVVTSKADPSHSVDQLEITSTENWDIRVTVWPNHRYDFVMESVYETRRWSGDIDVQGGKLITTVDGEEGTDSDDYTLAGNTLTVVSDEMYNFWGDGVDEPVPATATMSFQRGNGAPEVAITVPSDGATFTEGETATFEGSAQDPEDGVLTGSSLQWTSDLDGQLGTGEQIQTTLSAGTHEITLEATDSDGRTSAASISINVNSSAFQDLVGTWDATSMVFTSMADPSQSVDVIPLGVSLTITVRSNHRFTLTTTSSWETFTTVGDIDIQDGKIVITPDAAGTPEAFDYTLTVNTLTLTDDDDVTYDFDGDGEAEPAVLTLELQRL